MEVSTRVAVEGVNEEPVGITEVTGTVGGGEQRVEEKSSNWVWVVVGVVGGVVVLGGVVAVGVVWKIKQKRTESGEAGLLLA